MKRILGVLLAVFLCSNAFAQGINFEHVSFTEALAKAKQENKLVFMDCYTTWCGPCKILAKNIFPQEEVGTYFNEHFVSVKMDMEKGEGIELCKKYDVKAFPTLLFMDAEGKVLHTKVGGSDVAGLIAEAKRATDPSQRIGALAERYNKGERDVKFVSQYIQVLRRAYKKEEMTKVGQEFIANTAVDQLCNKDAFTILTYVGIEYNGEAYNHILTNKAKFVAVAGQEAYDRLVKGAINNYLNDFSTTSTLESLTSEIEKVKKDLDVEQQKELNFKFISKYYYAHKEFVTWFKLSVSNAEKIMATDKKMGQSYMLYTVYRVARDPDFENVGLYDKAIELTNKVIEEDANSILAYYSLANLYKKTLNKEKALENINIYIAKSSKPGESVDARIIKLKEEIESM